MIQSAPNTQVTEGFSDLIDQLDQMRTACEHFTIHSKSKLHAGLIQRDQRLAEFEVLFEQALQEAATATALVDALNAEIENRNQTIAAYGQRITELEQQLANLNVSIDQAQAQSQV